MDMRDIFGETLVELGKEFSNIVVLDGDLNTSTKTDLFMKRFPTRFIQVGIAEQNLFGIAAGLASEGYIPFPATFGGFAARRACDQVAISIAYPKFNVKIPGSYPGIPTSQAGASHNAVEDLAIMRALPHMRVVDPGDNRELRSVMREAVLYDGPVYFRVTRLDTKEITPPSYTFSWGKGLQLRQGPDVTLVGTGMMTAFCLEASELLAERGIEADVLHMPCLKPFDTDLLVRSVSKTKAVVTAENATIIGGLGGAVSESLGELAPTPIRRIGIKDQFIDSGSIEDLLAHYEMRPQDIASAALDAIAHKVSLP